MWRLTKLESDPLVVENQLRKREEIIRKKYVGGGVCELVSELLMWASEALMLDFLDSLRGGKKRHVSSI